MPRQTRRDFLATGSTLAAAGLSKLCKGAEKISVPVIDTHLHCFAGPNDARFPYHTRAPYTPTTAATPEHLLKCMDGAGVDYAVVVHPEPYQDDHRYLEHCLQTSDRLKGTCLFFADRTGSIAGLPQLVKKHPGRIVAARIHAYAPDRLPPFDNLDELWRTATDLGLAMQLHFEPRFGQAFEPYIKKYAKTRVIIDHLGRPFQGTPQEHRVILKWARFPNTFMKLCAIPAQDKYPHRDIAPVIRQLTDAWGAERMIYGGGFNAEATPESYRDNRERIRSYLAHLTVAEQADIFGRTAAKLYAFV